MYITLILLSAVLVTPCCNCFDALNNGYDYNNSNNTDGRKINIDLKVNNNNNLHIHYKSDHERMDTTSNEFKFDQNQNIDITANNKPVVYFETIFGAADLPNKDKQIVNLSGMRNNIRNDSIKRNSSIEPIPVSLASRSSLVSRGSTYRLFKKHVQSYTTFPLITKVGRNRVGSTSIRDSKIEGDIGGSFERPDDSNWEKRMIQWEATLTTDKTNFSEARQLNLYRYHYNHFFWHPSKTTTFWLLVISGILLSFLITGLGAILYLCHRDHDSSKMELSGNEDDDDDDDEPGHQNQWNNIERNTLAMELSATSKTELLSESSDSHKSNESSASKHTNEASETSFDLKQCGSQAQLPNSIFCRDEATKKNENVRFEKNSSDEISSRSLVECNYYWSSAKD